MAEQQHKYQLLVGEIMLLFSAFICSRLHAFQIHGSVTVHKRSDSYSYRPGISYSNTNDNDNPQSFFDEFDDADGIGSITRGTSSNFSSSKEAEVIDAGDGEEELDDEIDLSGVTYRQFKLGTDVRLTNFVGSLGFDEIVDWEYYYEDQDENTKKKIVVEPSPLDPTQPKRTRSSSGSVIRVYLGQLTGALGASLRSVGMDSRIIAKEFVGDMAANLAKAELTSIAKMQTELIRRETDSNEDTFMFSSRGSSPSSSSWAKTARYRNTSDSRSAKEADNSSVLQLVQLLQREKVPYVYILGSMIVDQDQQQIQDWYRTFGVTPLKSSSIWILYEYAGLRHAGLYAPPADVRKARLDRPPVKRVFGIPFLSAPIPMLPSWQERANYVVNGILRKTLEAVAIMHENGIVHKSIGLNSVILSSVGMDKTETSSLEAKSVERLVIKLADFGFSTTISAAAADKSYKTTSTAITRSPFFAVAEDLHALGFVFLRVLLTSLAELSSLEESPGKIGLPPTDEDRLQRVSYNVGPWVCLLLFIFLIRTSYFYYFYSFSPKYLKKTWGSLEITVKRKKYGKK